jgi:hypothetical protein
MRGPLLALTVAIVALMAEPATAAKPVAGARYLAECCEGDYFGHNVVLDLRVTSNGGRIRRGSHFGCDQDGTLAKLRPRGQPRISRAGRFRFRGRAHGYRFRVGGRFRSGDVAELTYRVRPRRHFGCPAGPRKARLRREVLDLPFSDCATHRARNVLTAPGARIFRQRKTWFRVLLPYAFGCLDAVNRRFELGLAAVSRFGSGQTLHNYRLAGPYAAYTCRGVLPTDFPYRTEVSCGSGVVRMDLRDGSVTTAGAVSVARGKPRVQIEGGSGEFVDVELKENGSFAWITAPDRTWGNGSGPREVWVLDAGGARMLERGSRIRAASLELDGSVLSWVNAGQTRTAAID